MLVLFFFLQGLIIMDTQRWDQTFCEVYPCAFQLHSLMNQPENVKRFIMYT